MEVSEQRRLDRLEDRVNAMEESRSEQHAENRESIATVKAKVNLLLWLLAANGGLEILQLRTR